MEDVLFWGGGGWWCLTQSGHHLEDGLGAKPLVESCGGISRLYFSSEVTGPPVFGVFKSVQVLLNGIEAVMVLTVIILKRRALGNGWDLSLAKLPAPASWQNF